MASQLLSQLKVQDITPSSNVIVVDSKDPLEKTFSTMVNNNVLCAPVLDKTSNQLMGLIDMIDIASAVSDAAHTNEQGSVDMRSKAKDFKLMATSDVADLSKRSKLFTLSAEASLLDAVNQMATHHIQRVPILDGGSVVNLLTQSAVIEYFAKNLDHLGPNVHKTLRDLHFEEKKVISIDHNMPAIDAFRLMAQNRISGLAVVDNERRLMANISARDLRTILNIDHTLSPSLSPSHSFEQLSCSVGEFVSHVRQANFRAIHPSICCTFDDTFAKIIMRIAATHIHRIYVVDENRYPISVISLHDVLKKIMELCNANVAAGSGGL